MTVPSGAEWSLANTQAPPSGAGDKHCRVVGSLWEVVGVGGLFSRVPDAQGVGDLGSVGHRDAVRLWSVEGFHYMQKETRF